MGIGKRLTKWALRRGNYGGTARTIGKQYQVTRQANPQMPRPDILAHIVTFRHGLIPYTLGQQARLRHMAALNPPLSDFVMEVVLAEANTYEHEIGSMAKTAREVISEELRILGLADE